MTETAQVIRDADELKAAIVGAIERSDVPTIAASAYMQATYAQQAAEAILQLLKHKNIISDAEVQKALGDSYHAKAVRLKNSGNIVVPPMLRPNGSF